MSSAVAARARPADVVRPTRSWTLQQGWLLPAAFVTYPLWWAVGLPFLAFPVMSTALLLTLRGRFTFSAPRWSGLWLLFLAWTVVTTVTILDQPDRLVAWMFRELSYVAAFLFLVAMTTLGVRLSTARVARALYVFWALVVLGGVFSLAVPDLVFTSPLAHLLPPAAQSHPMIADMLRPSFSDTSFVYGVPRPSFLFQYTNEWAAALGVLTPAALYARRHLRTLWARRMFWVILAVSVVPIVVSVNRGLWVSLAAAALFVAVQSGLHGRVGILLGLIGSVAVAGAAAIYTPLATVIATRLSIENLTTRQTLIGGALDYASRSPVIGYGAPVQTQLDNTHGLSVGTHGQLWTLLVSHGVPGVAFYVLFFLAALVALRRVPAHGWWLQAAVVVLLVQLPFYNAVGVPLAVAMLCVGLLLREQLDARHDRAVVIPAPTFARPPAAAHAATGQPAGEQPIRKDLS